MKENLYDRIKGFFQVLENSHTVKEQIKECNRVIQFDPANGEPFYVQIRHGKVDFGKGNKYPPDYELGLYIKGDQESLSSLFYGEMSLAESIYNHRIRVVNWRDNKEPMMVWFSKLLQAGIREKA